MSAKFVKSDLRSVKTSKALNVAMFSLLENRNFGKITVSNICEEALISRATFYLHFIDKYDLLKDSLMYLALEAMKKKGDSYDKIEESFNKFIQKNEPVIKNLIYDANDETLTILFDSILTTLDLPVWDVENGEHNPKYVVLSNFYAGGILYYCLWHVKNRFPSDVAPMNPYFYGLLEKFYNWNINIGGDFLRECPEK